MEVNSWFEVAPRTGRRIVSDDNAVSSSMFVCFFYRVSVGNLQRNNLDISKQGFSVGIGIAAWPVALLQILSNWSKWGRFRSGPKFIGHIKNLPRTGHSKRRSGSSWWCSRNGVGDEPGRRDFIRGGKVCNDSVILLDDCFYWEDKRYKYRQIRSSSLINLCSVPGIGISSYLVGELDLAKYHGWVPWGWRVVTLRRAYGAPWLGVRITSPWYCILFFKEGQSLSELENIFRVWNLVDPGCGE